MTNFEQRRQEIMRVVYEHLFKCEDCQEKMTKILHHSQTTEDVSTIVEHMEETKFDLYRKSKDKGYF